MATNPGIEPVVSVELTEAMYEAGEQEYYRRSGHSISPITMEAILNAALAARPSQPPADHSGLYQTDESFNDPPDVDIGEMVERVSDVLDIIAAAEMQFAQTPEHHTYYTNCHIAVQQAVALLTDRDDLVRSMREVAERLSEQRDEPWPGGTIAERLHYWRDKAIKAADDLRAALKVLDGS